jgi:hypothetical protein
MWSKRAEVPLHCLQWKSRLIWPKYFQMQGRYFEYIGSSFYLMKRNWIPVQELCVFLTGISFEDPKYWSVPVDTGELLVITCLSITLNSGRIHWMLIIGSTFISWVQNFAFLKISCYYMKDGVLSCALRAQRLLDSRLDFDWLGCFLRDNALCYTTTRGL